MQDAVPRVGKFLTLFSRPGKRVIIDYRGDVVVRPSHYEIFIRNGEPAAAHAAQRAWPPVAGPAESHLSILGSCQGASHNFEHRIYSRVSKASSEAKADRAYLTSYMPWL